MSSSPSPARHERQEGEGLAPLALTACWTAAARARETEREDRLFEDPLAELLAGEAGRALLEAEPQDSPYLAIRTRWFDDWLRQATDDGIRQMVIVAAGMDTRAFRLPWPPGVWLWELDQPALLRLKDDLLAEVAARPRCRRIPLGVDLVENAWGEPLIASGLRPDRPSAWLLEGVLPYLEPTVAERLLDRIGDLAAPGSRLGADLPSRELLDSEWTRPYLQHLENMGTPWRFGHDRPEELLGSRGWRQVHVAQPGEAGAGAERWPWPVPPRDVPGIPRNFLVTAVR
ncbi:MAG TPA: SAM-dependent methyltransferase [Candidatus Dormibacteraeota bacterium]|nr:SAM-dependent methyltransferase [Candidatus Dormibacteraeota bacterium]